MGNQYCQPSRKLEFDTSCQVIDSQQIMNLQNMNYEQFPSSCLSKKLSSKFTQAIIASKNIMRQQHQNMNSNILSHIEETNNNNQKEIKEQDLLDEMFITPPAANLRKTRIKKPTFLMVQIDPRKFISMKSTPIQRDYEILEEIGKGGYGVVYKAQAREDGEARAIKTIKKSLLSYESKMNLINEFQILKQLDHPNIIKLYDIYEDEENYYAVTELCEGGTMLQYLNNHFLSIKFIRAVMIQLFRAVKYMHGLNILHRDLKLENMVLVSDPGENGQNELQIKLIDFGISIDLNKTLQRKTHQIVGTLLYMAPEALRGEVNLSLDMWSCGIICYILCAKQMPYSYKTEDELTNQIKRGNVNRKNLKKVAAEVQVFITQLLHRDPKSRIDVEKALKCRWLHQKKKHTLAPHELAEVAKQILAYDAKNNLVCMIESYLVSRKINQEERHRLAIIFQEIDAENNGYIGSNQFKKFYKQNSESYDEQQVEELISIIDKNGSGKIDFNEFIGAMYNRKKLFQQKNLEEAFDFFDKSHTGDLSKEQLRDILVGVDDDQLQFLFKQIKTHEGETVTKQQFIKYLMNYNNSS